jgi:hypothetical protein
MGIMYTSGLRLVGNLPNNRRSFGLDRKHDAIPVVTVHNEPRGYDNPGGPPKGLNEEYNLSFAFFRSDLSEFLLYLPQTTEKNIR